MLQTQKSEQRRRLMRTATKGKMPTDALGPGKLCKLWTMAGQLFDGCMIWRV